jgi:hypothetical protein
MGFLDDKHEIIRREVAAYAKPALTGERSYLAQSDDGKLLSVVDVDTSQGRHSADTGLVARIAGDFVIIEHDMNDKPLVDALVKAGIPRQNIILAYAGEPVPEAAL